METKIDEPIEKNDNSNWEVELQRHSLEELQFNLFINRLSIDVEVEEVTNKIINSKHYNEQDRIIQNIELSKLMNIFKVNLELSSKKTLRLVESHLEDNSDDYEEESIHIEQKQHKRGPGRPKQTEEEKQRKLIAKNRDKSNDNRKLTDSFLIKN